MLPVDPLRVEPASFRLSTSQRWVDAVFPKEYSPVRPSSIKRRGCIGESGESTVARWAREVTMSLSRRSNSAAERLSVSSKP